MARDDFAGITAQTKASRHRREDAQKLLEARRWRGAMYLAGYAVECRLKQKLMHKFGCLNLPELAVELSRRNLLADENAIFTHSLERLLRLTGGLDRIRQSRETWSQFNLVNRWVPAWRYKADAPAGTDAEDFLRAVDATLHWIDVNL